MPALWITCRSALVVPRPNFRQARKVEPAFYGFGPLPKTYREPGTQLRSVRNPHFSKKSLGVIAAAKYDAVIPGNRNKELAAR